MNAVDAILRSTLSPTYTTVVLDDSIMTPSAERNIALANDVLRRLVDLLNEAPGSEVQARPGVAMRIPGGYALTVLSALAPAAATRRVRGVLAQTGVTSGYTVRSHRA